MRREYLDRILFWNQGDLERKLENYKTHYNQHRCHSGLAGATRLNGAACPHRQSQNLSHIPGGNIAEAYFRPQLQPELEFDTDGFARNRRIYASSLNVVAAAGLIVHPKSSLSRYALAM